MKQSTDQISSFDSLNNLASARSIAISAGDLSAVVRQEVKKILGKKGCHQLDAVKVGINQLLERNLISTREAKDITVICNELFGAIRGKEDSAKAASIVREIYQQMLVDHQCSPTALAIASVTNASFEVNSNEVGREGQRELTTAAIVITPETTGAGAATGAIIGGIIGGIVGGGLGAGIGAAIGGAVGGAIGLCNEENV